MKGTVCYLWTDWGSVSSRAECAGVADAEAAGLLPFRGRGASRALPAAAEGAGAHSPARRHSPAQQEASH